MSKNVLFSIIIPVYNMELYLNRCLDSIVNQNYKNLEIIIINDGSKDKSIDIINYYAKKDNRITVINKENEGIGGAYIDALKIVTGDYISFIDGDDFVELNMYEKLNQYILDKNPDILQFGYRRIDEENSVLVKGNFGSNYIVGNINIENYRYKKIKHPSVGLKVTKRHLFDNLQILRQNVGIDVLITIQIYLKAESLLLIEDFFYNIFIRNNSVSRLSYDENRIIQLIKLRELIFKISMSTRDIVFISHVLPSLINETQIIISFYNNNNEFEKMNKLVFQYRTYYKLLFKILKLCKIKIILKATWIYFFPTFSTSNRHLNNE